MRTTSNPAFRNLPTGGYAGFGSSRSSGPGVGLGTARSSAPAAARPLTIDDVVIKTALTLGLAVLTGVATALAGPAASGLVLPAALVGLVLGLVVAFKRDKTTAVTRVLVLGYAGFEGIVLGGISYMFARMFDPSIILQAIGGTVGVFIAMLVVYKTGAVRVTPKFTKWLIGAMAGAFVLMLINFVMAMFGLHLGLREGGPLGIIFSLVVIGIAAFSFLLDFDMADRAIRSGADSRLAWYIAFGLMVTLVWLYLEILRLLSYLRE